MVNLSRTLNSKELPDGPEPCGQNCRLWAESENVLAGLLQVRTNFARFARFVTFAQW